MTAVQLPRRSAGCELGQLKGRGGGQESVSGVLEA